MRKSFVRVLLFVVALSIGALALSPSALGAEKKTLQKISQGYANYYDGVDPALWGFMQ
jgi:hypothetical protein